MPATSDRSRRPGRATDHTLRSQTVDDRRRVETDDSGDWSSSIGDDDVVSVACCVDPPAEVSSEFGDCNIHGTKCTLGEALIRTEATVLRTFRRAAEHPEPVKSRASTGGSWLEATKRRADADQLAQPLRAAASLFNAAISRSRPVRLEGVDADAAMLTNPRRDMGPRWVSSMPP